MRVRVREWRERKGLSYRDLAKQAGIALSTLYRVESGSASPTVALLAKLADALEVHITDLLPPKPPKRTRRTSR